MVRKSWARKVEEMSFDFVAYPGNLIFWQKRLNELFPRNGSKHASEVAVGS